jgi:hypothetical protein
MKTAGFALQILALLIGIFGVLGGAVIIMMSTTNTFAYRTDPTVGIVAIFFSIVSWAFLYGVGRAFEFIEDIAVDTRKAREANERTAKSIELLVYRQRQKQSQVLPSSSKFDFSEAPDSPKRPPPPFK